MGHRLGAVEARLGQAGRGALCRKRMNTATEAYAGVAQAPEWFTTAPAEAIRKLLKKTGLAAADIDRCDLVAVPGERVEIDRKTVRISGFREQLP